MRVRFTAWHAYPLFDPRDPACVGGAETHAWLLANALASRSGFDVHFVVRSSQRFHRRHIGEVTVWNASDSLDGIRRSVAGSVTIGQGPFRLRLHRFYPQLAWQLPVLAAARLVRGPRPPPWIPAPIYGETRADVECCFGVSAQSAAAIAAARKVDAPSILFLESNSDLDERFTPDSTYVTVHGERADICRRVLDGATQIIAQHPEQRRLLKERFGRDSVVWPNIVDLPSWDSAATQPSAVLKATGLTRFALWVGRADDFHKRPQLCLDLARRLPEVPFLMVLNPGDDQIERSIRDSAPPNVRIVTAIPFAEMPAVLSAATLYVSTGSAEYEGSPNIFLQAAASRIPVASLDVETPLIAGTGAGLCTNGSLDQLAEYIAAMFAHPDRARAAGEMGRRIVERDHAPAAVVDRLATLVHQFVP
jgi:glycosyltransferase involved in cell wall biosynthesis